MNTWIIAHIDKTVIRISGVEVKGLKPYELERKLEGVVERKVRIIGVTGNSIEMDIYDMEPDAIFRSEDGIIRAISMTEGISPSEVVKINSVEKIVEVDVNDIPKGYHVGCAKERWLNVAE